MKSTLSNKNKSPKKSSKLSNIGNNIVFSSINILKNMTPNISETSTSAIDSIRDIKSFAIRARSPLNSQEKVLGNLSVGKRAKSILNTALSDITENRFSRKKSEEMFMNDAEFDFDFSESGDEITYDSEEMTDPKDTSTAILGKTIISGNVATMEAISDMTDILAKTQLRSNEISSAKMTNMSLLSLNKVNASLMTIDNRLVAINNNLVSMMQFQNENVSVVNQAMLEYFDLSLSSLKDLAKASKMGPEDDSWFKLKPDSFLSNGFNIKGYMDFIKKNFNNSIIGSMLAMKKTMDSMGDKTPLGQSVLEFVMGSMVPEKISKSITKFDKNISTYMREGLYKLGDMKMDYSSKGNMITRFIGEMLGLERSSRSLGPSMGNFHKEEMGWNGIAQKTLIEVIPSYLAGIEAGILKTDKRHYDMERGKFYTEKMLKSEYIENARNNLSIEMIKPIDMIYKYIEKANKEFDPDSEKIFKRQFNDLINARYSGEIVKGSDFQNQLATVLSPIIDNDKNMFKNLSLLIEERINRAIENDRQVNTDIEKNNYSSGVNRHLHNIAGAELDSRKIKSDIFSYTGGNMSHVGNIRGEIIEKLDNLIASNVEYRDMLPKSTITGLE